MFRGLLEHTRSVDISCRMSITSRAACCFFEGRASDIWVDRGGVDLARIVGRKV